MDCIFCKIVAHELPATTIYEDEQCLAFLDIHPVQIGHVLVIPKIHAETLPELDELALLPTARLVKLMSQAIIRGLLADGCTVSQNNGRAAGQVVPHVHFHVIPRYASDDLHAWPNQKYASSENKEEVAKKIREYVRPLGI